MYKILLIIALFLLRSGITISQTYQGSGGAVSNTGTPTYYNLNVNGLPENILDTVFGLETVLIRIMHPHTSELDIRLIAPDGRSIVLSSGNGGSGNNYYDTEFNDFASSSIILGIPPFNGTYRPEQYLGTFNDGMIGNGNWQLYVNDLIPNNANSGYVTNWRLTFGYNPGPVFHFCSSNLPIVCINTHGQVIPDDPKIPVDMGIIDNGSGQRNYLTDTFAYEGKAGIEIRGSSSQMFPKKSYGFETWDIFGQEIDTSLLGMPAESDWILNANYSDKTLCRNILAYQSFMNLDHYATRYRFVELVINNEYLGVYVFSEKIKRNKNRVDIAKLLPEEISGDELTGGYIVKIDKSTGSGGDGWVSPFYPPVSPSGQFIFFQYDYPASDEIVQQQKDYIREYVTTFEAALEGPFFADTALGFRKYADELSFIDYFIVNEISKNVDGYRLSTFLYKDKESNGGKLKMGPVWDYDIAWHNADYCGGDILNGWAYQFPCEYDYWQVPFWWSRLMQDPLFTEHLKCRWLLMRSTTLSNDYFMSFIDSVATLLDESQFRNFLKWPILGTYVWPNPAPFPESYEEEINVLKSWLVNRLNWIDQNLPGTCTTIGVGETAEKQMDIQIFPNPATSYLTVTYSLPIPGNISIELLNESGSTVLRVYDRELIPGSYLESINLSDMSPGVYILRFTQNSEAIYRKFVKF